MTTDLQAIQRQQRELLDEANRLYEQYAKPLEQQHHGKFIAIAHDGRTVMGESARQVGRAAEASFGPGNFVFKLGERATGRWR